MTQAPKRMFVCSPGKEPPDWVVERMTTGTINKDGSFEMETSDGKQTIMKGMAIAEAPNGHVFATVPQRVTEKLAEVALRTPAPPRQPTAPEPVAPPPSPAPSVAAEEPPAPAPARKQMRAMVALGSPPTIEWIGIDRLEVDDSYQRSIEGGASQKLITKIGMEWDWRLCIPLIVSRRTEGMFVIDGQHRLEGARLRHDIPHLPCAVFTFDSVEAEAELFVQANRSRRPMQRLDEFHAAILAGDEKATAINSVVAEAGLFVGRNAAWQMIRPKEVVFVGGVQRVMRAHGRDMALTALQIIAEAFDGQSLSSAGSIFDALTALMAERKDKPIDPAAMVKVLAARTMKEWRERVPRGDTNGFERTIALKEVLAEDYEAKKGGK